MTLISPREISLETQPRMWMTCSGNAAQTQQNAAQTQQCWRNRNHHRRKTSETNQSPGHESAGHLRLALWARWPLANGDFPDSKGDSSNDQCKTSSLQEHEKLRINYHHICGLTQTTANQLWRQSWACNADVLNYVEKYEGEAGCSTLFIEKSEYDHKVTDSVFQIYLYTRWGLNFYFKANS